MVDNFTKGQNRLILVAPPYLSDGKAFSALLDKEAFGLALEDLSMLDHRAFNLAMVSTKADVMLLVIDASFGLEKRSFWAKALACLASVPHIVLAIDNMALIDWSRERFDELCAEFEDYAVGFDCRQLSAIPVNLATDDNIFQPSPELSWHAGPLLMELLSVEVGEKSQRLVDDAIESSDQFAVHLCWTSDTPMLSGRHYLFKYRDEQTQAYISALKYRINPENMEHQAAKRLLPGEIGYCNISLNEPVAFEIFRNNRNASSFWLYDKATGKQMAFGLIKHALRRATNIKWQALDISKAARAASKNQTPCVLWFTGLSGSGKSTIASLIEKKLHAVGKHTYLLDGDNVRHGLCRDLGFTEADRIENLRRISETAKMFVDAGLIVIVSFISPFRSERRASREIFANGEFIEVFVDTPLEVCEARDPKGLYKKARAGQLANFTGIDSPYEPPESAEIILSAADTSPEQLSDIVIENIVERGLLPKDIFNPSSKMAGN